MLSAIEAVITNELFWQLSIAFVFGTLFIGGGLYFIGRGLVLGRRALTLWRSDPISVQAVGYADGPVEVEGRVSVADDTLKSPFTETQCVTYQYRVDEHTKSSNGGSWDTQEKGRKSVPFLLEDDTGSVLIDPSTADLSLTSGDRITVSPDETPPDPIPAFLETIGIEPVNDPGTHLGPVSLHSENSRRYAEEYLEPGDNVYVYGPVKRGEPTPGSFDTVVRSTSRWEQCVVSDTDESETITRTARKAALMLVGGLGAFSVGGNVLYGLLLSVMDLGLLL